MARNKPAPPPVPARVRYEIIDPKLTHLVFRGPGEERARTHFIGPDDPCRTEGIVLYTIEAEYYVEQGALVPFGLKPKSAMAELARATAEGENPAAEKPRHRK